MERGPSSLSGSFAAQMAQGCRGNLAKHGPWRRPPSRVLPWPLLQVLLSPCPAIPQGGTGTWKCKKKQTHSSLHCFSSEYSPAATEGKLEHTLGITENATPKPVSNGKKQNFENGKPTGMQKVSFLENSIYKNSVSYLIFLSSFFLCSLLRVSSKCFLRNSLLLMAVTVSFLSPMSNTAFYLWWALKQVPDLCSQ